ncbi:enoyl-CoA hydratase/isomerase family protein [Nocardioides sp. KIGAM211]|uniref:enoyl-CoA hydratase n=2 Tax=Nocardioides luti TaxID=2761101 RepID=A0A7X0RFX3_9ACTN|nr:enoyl-CoA hydratase/isomerase family protein [Nocardioides luti]
MVGTVAGLEVEMIDGIALVTISRPEAGNSIDPPTASALNSLWLAAAEDDDVVVVVVIGAGERFFCTGMDLKKTATPGGTPYVVEYLKGQQLSFAPPVDFHKPTLVALNGMALGAGLELALACDVRIAAVGAELGLPEVKIGSMPGQGGTQRLPRLIPRSVAMKMLLTGDRMSASDALRYGLVTDVVEAAELKTTALELAGRIASAAPLAVQAVKTAVNLGADLPLEDALRLEAFLWGSLRETHDRTEGRTAFAEKRPPRWQGR